MGKTTRPFRYDLNQIPYDYTVEVRNRFKGLDLIERLMNYGQRFVTLYSIQESRPSPRKKVRQWTWVHHELVIDREAWHASVHGVAKSWTWLRDWTEWSTDWLTDMYQAPHPGWLSGKKKKSACQAGDSGSIPGSGRSLGDGNGNPLQYSCLEKPMDRGAWWAIDHYITKRVRHNLANKQQQTFILWQNVITHII